MTEEQEVPVQEEDTESYDTSDKEAVNKAKKKASRTKADRLKFIRAAMSHPEGRGWFYDVLVFTHVIRTPFVEGDPYATAFRCGEQNIGLRILGDIQEAAPEFYLNMINENQKSK